MAHEIYDVRLIQEGPRDACIVFVGEAPGTQEAATGRPFVGGAGYILDTMLGRVGIRRSHCFITNVCHEQPPSNKIEAFLHPLAQCVKDGIMQLRDDIMEIKPHVVCALGAFPLQVLTGRTDISKWRGSIVESSLVPGQKIVATYHPAFILRSYDYKAVAEFDLRRVLAQATFPEIRRPQRELILDPPREAVPALVDDLLRADWLAVDIECIGTEGTANWELACVGFADRPSCALVLPTHHQWQRDAIRRLCESNARKVLQNGTFDATVLKANGITLENFAWDTMLAHHALYPECAGGEDEMSRLGGRKRQAAFAKGLAFQTSIYTEEPYYKDSGKLWKETGDVRLFYRYCALDAAVTREIRDVQDRELSEVGTHGVFRHEMSLVQPLMDITGRGIRIDLDLRERLRVEYTDKSAQLQSDLDARAGLAVNVKSSQQVCALLYDRLGLPVQRDKDSHSRTADKDAIAYLEARFDNPILRRLVEVRQTRDFLERYLEAKVDADGRMRCAFDITGTRTGRLSSRQSIYGSGTNLQNIPKRRKDGEAIRRMFTADPGMVLVERDYSQAEIRIVAYLSECEPMIRVFEEGRDIHAENAARIFRTNGRAVTDTERYVAKAGGHAADYGVEAGKLVEMIAVEAPYTGIRITLAEAQRVLDGYFLLYPEIKSVFWKEVERELRYSRTLTTPEPFCRRRQFFGRWDDKLLREAYAYIPQSVVGDMGALALVRCYDVLEREMGIAQVLLNVHDSIICQCHERDAERVAEAMARVMDIPLTIKGREVHIPSDCSVGRNWGKATTDNPEGLRKL